MTLRRTDFNPSEQPAAGGVRRVLCPVGHSNTPFDVYCGECGIELNEAKNAAITQKTPHVKVPVAKCLAGHSVSALDVTCPLCGLGIVRSSAHAPNNQGRTVTPPAPSTEDNDKTTTSKPTTASAASLQRTSRRERLVSFVEDYWAAAVVVAVILTFVVCAVFLSSIKLA